MAPEDPGKNFNSAKEAAINWGMTYNNNSILYKREFGSVIYRTINAKGEEQFAYTKPIIGTGKNTEYNRDIPEGAEIVAYIHFHGAYSVPIDNQFSRSKTLTMGAGLGRSDIDFISKVCKPAYLTAPNGSLLYWDPESMANSGPEIVEGVILPGDTKDPTFRGKS